MPSMLSKVKSPAVRTSQNVGGGRKKPSGAGKVNYPAPAKRPGEK